MSRKRMRIYQLYVHSISSSYPCCVLWNSTPDHHDNLCVIVDQRPRRSVNQAGKVAAHNLAFNVQDLSGSGKGLVALRCIAPGELLTKEKPLLHGISPRPTQPLLSTPPSMGAPLLNILLSSPSRSNPAHVYDANLPLGIFETSAVAAGRSIELFPSMARLSHGCLSVINTINFWRDVEGMLVTHALRPIKKGDITTSPRQACADA